MDTSDTHTSTPRTRTRTARAHVPVGAATGGDRRRHGLDTAVDYSNERVHTQLVRTRPFTHTPRAASADAHAFRVLLPALRQLLPQLRLRRGRLRLVARLLLRLLRLARRLCLRLLRLAGLDLQLELSQPLLPLTLL